MTSKPPPAANGTDAVSATSATTGAQTAKAGHEPCGRMTTTASEAATAPATSTETVTPRPGSWAASPRTIRTASPSAGAVHDHSRRPASASAARPTTADATTSSAEAPYRPRGDIAARF